MSETTLLRRALDQVEAAVGQLGGVTSAEADRLRRAANLARELVGFAAEVARIVETLAGEIERAATIAEAQRKLAVSTVELAASAGRLAPPGVST